MTTAVKRTTGLRVLVCWFVVTVSASGVVLAQSVGPVAKTGDLPSSNQKAALAVEAFAKLPLSFEANTGQTDSRVKFLARGPGYTLLLMSNEAVLTLPAPYHTKNWTGNHEDSSSMTMRLAGTNPTATISGVEELPGKSNYFIGNDPRKWRTDIPNYAKVQCRGVYPGVDLVYYGNQGRVEYDFVVAAGSDPQAIRLAFEQTSGDVTRQIHGTTPSRINRNGDLMVSVDGSEIRLHKPTAYQLTTDGHSRHLVEARYMLRSDGQVGIRLAPYDNTRTLIIDPVLTYSTRLGGSGGQLNAVIAVDAAGNVYVSGTTGALNFPVVNQISGACQGTCSTGFQTVFVTKINATGTALVYSSLIGGSNRDDGMGIAVDGSGNAYLTGAAFSTDFPRVNQIPGACVGACGTGIGNAFITKVSAAGDALVYSSLVGGTNIDSAHAIAVDGFANAYLTGATESTDFPQVNPIPGACLGTCGTGSPPQDGFVTEVNAAGTALVYSSYLAGSAFTFGSGIAADSVGNAYVVGITQSADFPRVNQIAAICAGTCGTGTSDGFVTKISAQGTSLAYSSVFGGSGFDMGTAIAVDGSGNAYLTGSTQSADFPQINQTKKACARGCGNGLGDAFIIKIDSAGNAAAYSSLLGGAADDEATGIAVDALGNAYVTGFTKSTNFPSVSPIKGACLGTCGKTNVDVFVVKVDAPGTTLGYSSLIGGSDIDQGQGIAADASGNVYLTGFTQSADFPVVNQIPGACLGSCGSAFNQVTFVIKLAP